MTKYYFGYARTILFIVLFRQRKISHRERISLWNFRISYLAVFIWWSKESYLQKQVVYNFIDEISCLISCYINCLKVIVFVWLICKRFYGFSVSCLFCKKLNRIKLRYFAQFFGFISPSCKRTFKEYCIFLKSVWKIGTN